MSHPHPHSVAIVGAGHVGATAAYALLLLLSQHFGVDARSVHAHIIGEHGDTEVQAIIRDESTVLTVSSRVSGSYGLEDVCLSLPCIVNRSGVAQLLAPSLTKGEVAALHHSATVLKAAQSTLQ